jgi:hypothetical protein
MPEAIAEIKLEIFFQADFDLVLSYVLIGMNEVEWQNFDIRKAIDKGAL